MISNKGIPSISSLIILVLTFAQTTQAKSVYVINDTEDSNLSAYKIEDTNLVHQTDYVCQSDPSGATGAVGLAIDESEYDQFLFVTFEGTNKIELVNAKTMKYIDMVEAPQANNLAGIVADKIRRKVYIINRESNHLYVYSWDAENRELTLDYGAPYYVELEDCFQGFGLSFDYENDRLYVADNTTTVKCYDANDPNWSKLDEFTFTITDKAVGIAVDVNNQYVYTGSSQFDSSTYLTKYDLSASSETRVNVGSPVLGIAVDQDTSLVYLTTYETGSNPDKLIIYDSNLVKQPWDSSDIGNPAGVAVGTTAQYKPPLFYLEKVDVNEPNCVIPDDDITYTISYANPPVGDPNYIGDVNDVVITDYLPVEVDYVSSVPEPNEILDSNTIIWKIGTLSPGDGGSVTLTVKVNECILGCGTITNFCEAESDSTYNTAEANTPVCSASSPNPTCGAIVDLDVGEFNLTWCPGLFAADVNGHEVYFGSNFNDVNDANNLWPIGGVYKGPVTDPCYQLRFSDLELHTTYYWRIDEVNTNPPDVRWRGGVWRFTTGNYLVVENFDSYASNTALTTVWKHWKDNGSKAELSVMTPAINPDLVQDGNSMKYRYDNRYDPYYAEADAYTTGPNPLPGPPSGSDWTSGGVKALVMSFYGQSGNDANEQMYVRLYDADSNAVVTYGDYGEDPNDLRLEQWQQWNIDLEDFNSASVDLTNVTRITIGFGDKGGSGGDGTVYFDNIRLYLRWPIPTDPHKFYIKNASGEPVAWFGNLGNLVLKGTLTENRTPVATDKDEFRVQDSTSADVAIIDTTDGNMYIKEWLYEEQETLTPSPASDDFIIKNDSGKVVAYVDESGNVYLTGQLHECSNP